ncbi:MAG: DNA polymerase I [Bacilli bacterium]|nr:DNA polymerase I [Bacilli bacterium]
MEKIILVDGNNLLFRSYYATAYNGNFMNNSKGFPTNALFGFANMMNKIIMEENPSYILVAFDKGKTFRHNEYSDYKGGRIETPDELKRQFPVAKEMLTYMGIKYYEIDNYEADDIIGTFASYCDNDPNFIGTIISSDKDLLQLISNDIDIKLLKQKDYIRYNESTFKEEYGINPINIIDLKALMGDPSDNIPGVKGVGEKTALKLLQEYKTLDGIYEHINEIKGKLQEKLIADKDNAYMSYHLATIIKDVPMDIDINDLKYKEKDIEKLNNLYEELEFYSFIKKEKKKFDDINVTIVDSLDNLVIKENSSAYLEILGANYHTSDILGLAIYNSEQSLFIPFEVLKNIKKIDNISSTYDFKKMYVALKWHNIEISDNIFDLMIAGNLLNYNIKDDIAYLSNQMGYSIPFYDSMYQKVKTKSIYEAPDIEEVAKIALLKARFIYENKVILEDKLIDEGMIDLFETIENPLAHTLGDMEFNGVYVNVDVLDKLGEKFISEEKNIEKEIYDLAGVEFNISSPKQLGEVLFEKLNLSHGKKNKNGYSTSVDILNKIRFEHPIVDKIIDYRTVTKLYTTYVEGLKNCVLKDGKVHTIFTQTLTRTGRLSSIEPNLQNIPIRSEYGKLIRKAFVPSLNSVILSSDYSQIELRVMSHMAGIKSLKDAFLNGIDVHTKTASDIYKVPTDEVTKSMRRMAKATNFGIIYGISKYGLSENLGISPKEAGEFMDNYLATYPGIEEFKKSTIDNAYKNGYVKTLTNRKRYIEELKNANYMIRQSGERIALNTPIQGTAADMIKLAMVNIDKRFRQENIKSKMIIQVHDELVFDTLNDELDRVIEIVKDEMDNVIKLDVPLSVDIEYGSDWYEAK